MLNLSIITESQVETLRLKPSMEPERHFNTLEPPDG